MKSIHWKARRVWQEMLRRCTDERSAAWQHYGGRGIRVCERWVRFDAFLLDMGDPPPGLELDRRDNDGNYTPGNCRWATVTEQARNRRTTRNVTFNGETKCVSAWAKEKGISVHLLFNRLKAGWTIADALNVPPIPPRDRRGRSFPASLFIEIPPTQISLRRSPASAAK